MKGEVTMKRYAVLFMLATGTVTLINAQETVRTEALTEYSSDHYLVRSDTSEELAQSLASRMEAAFHLFNRYYRFDPEALPAPLSVRIFSSKADYDAYLQKKTGITRESFIYLHYQSPAKRELVGYLLEDETELNRQLLHQGSIQFLRAFVNNPPLWLQEGMAVFFEACEYDPETSSMIYRENLTWLDPLRTLASQTGGLIPLSEFLHMDLEAASRNLELYYPQAWGFVSFLVYEWDKEYNRILWDTIRLLSPSATYEENLETLDARVFSWYDIDQMKDRLLGYLEGKKSFRVLLEEGIEAYRSGDLQKAEEAFTRASKLDPDHYAPYYYLGLIAYTRGTHSLAEYYYTTALERGAEEAATTYALGLNAFAADRMEEARTYLVKAQTLAPDKYGEKVQALLERMGSEGM
ncbi:Tetratricopeptide TPR_2 repeat-containing protein [Spirochaeta thermophila DSM 6578]|uniref:Tetratricopeptide TPR_2 repeat-containing protein n=2 Tax=Winmispira thermophila TaxID=154 RepID=G0GEJ8_WINT7|nr:Tetratricopeptide TPR_2 repeat-containing protein [Spirochaeta thermophila DSM 6578]